MNPEKGRGRWLAWMWVIVALTATGLCDQAGNALGNRIDLLARWLRSPRESIRLEAVTAIDDLPIQNASPLLISAINDTSTLVRAAVAISLARTRDPRAFPLMRPLLKDSDEHVRAAAAWGIAYCGGKAALPDILPLCRDDASGLVRFRAVWGLAIIRDKSALPTAVDALSDYNASVRERSALLALEVLADETIGDRLVKQAQSEFPPTRRIVMYLFSRYGDVRQVVPVLEQGLGDHDPLVRAEAALSLGKRASKRSLPLLLPLLKDTDDHVRGATAHALGLVGDVSAAKDLRGELDDSSAFVRAVSAEALQQLGDKTVQPPAGFKSADLFTYPIYSPEHVELYR